MNLIIRNIDKVKDLELFEEFINLALLDLPGFRKLTKDHIQQYVLGDPEFDESMNFLALDDNRIIGRAECDMETNDIGFIALQLLPEYRNIQTMELLYNASLKILKAKDVEKIRTMVPAQFNDQLEFYKAKGYYMKWIHYSMERDLSLSIQDIDDLGFSISVPNLDIEYEEVRNTIDLGFSDSMESTKEMMDNFDKELKEEYFDNNGIFVAKGSGSVIGAIITAIHPARKERGHIPWLAVNEGYRRKGIGKALLMTSLAWLKEKGAEKASLSVAADNPNAMKLYKDIGFEVIKETQFLEVTL